MTRFLLLGSLGKVIEGGERWKYKRERSSGESFSRDDAKMQKKRQKEKRWKNLPYRTRCEDPVELT